MRYFLLLTFGFSLCSDDGSGCIKQLLQSVDSSMHTFVLHEVKDRQDISYQRKAIMAAEHLLGKTGCDPKKSMSNPKVECHMFSPRWHRIMTCFIQTDEVYYVVAEDYVDSYNVIVGRYD